jgi:HK97 gp10 family phage protein
MAKVTAEFDPNGGELGRQVNDILQRRMRQIIRLVAADARVNAPVDTGRLAQAIKEDPITSDGPFRVTGGVTSHAPYSAFVHQGTKPHVIRPRNASALKFQMGGKTVFAKSVNHPGTRPRPFLTKAVERVLGSLE